MLSIEPGWYIGRYKTERTWSCVQVIHHSHSGFEPYQVLWVNSLFSPKSFEFHSKITMPPENT